MAYQRPHGVTYPTLPTLPTLPTTPNVNPLQGVTLPSYPVVPSVNYWVKGTLWNKQYTPSKPIQTDLFDYNNPYEINSILDVVLGTFDRKMEHTKFRGLENIPLLNMIPDAVGLLYRGTIKPIIKGNWKTFALNTVMNFGETMDILANPLKGLIYEGKQGMLNAFGLGDDGRHNYDFHTGNKVVDLMLEILIDPLNWATLFGKGAVVLTNKAALAGTIKEAAGEAGEAFAKQVGVSAADEVFNKMAKNAIKAYLQGDADTVYKAVTNIAEAYSKRNLIKFTNILLPKDIITALYKAETIALNRMTITNLKALQHFIKPAETIQKTLIKSVLISSGVKPAWWLLGQIGSDLKGVFEERARSALKEYTRPKNNITFSKYDEIKNTCEEVTNQFNVALALEQEDKLPSDLISTIMRQGVVTDNQIIESLFTKYWKKPRELITKLAEYLRKTHQVDTLDDYLEIIKKVNFYEGGIYEDVVRYYTEQVKNMEQILNKEAWDQTVGIIQMVKDRAEEVLEPLQKQFLKSDAFKYIDWDAITPNKSIINSTLETRLEYVLYPYKVDRLRPFKGSDITKDLKTAYTDWYFEVAKPTKDEIIKLNNRLQVNNLDPAGYFQEFTHEFMEAISSHRKQMYEQFNTFKKLGKNTTKKQVWKSVRQISLDYKTDMFQIIDDLLKKYNYILDHGPVAYSQVIFTDFFRSSLQTSRLQFSMADDLIKNYMRNYKSVTTLSPKAIENFQIIKAEIAAKLDGYTGYVPEHWGVQLSSSAEAFMNATLDNTLQFESRFFDLQKDLELIKGYMINTLEKRPDEAVEALVQHFTDILNTLELYNPIEYYREKIKVQAAGIMIQLKLEQTQTSLALINNTNVDNFIQDVFFKMGLGEGIQTIAETAANTGDAELDIATEVCRKIVQAGENYKHYVDLLNSIARAPMDQRTRLAFISTIQKHAMKNPTVVLENFDYYFKQIVNDLELQRYSIEMKTPLKLEVLKENLQEYLRQYHPDVLTDVQHTAKGDVKLLEAVMEKLLPEEFQNPLYRYFIADIETSGGAIGSGTITNIAIKEYGASGEPFEWLLKIDPDDLILRPNSRVLNTFFPIGEWADEIKTIVKDEADQVRAFQLRHANGNVLTEAELLNNFIQKMQKLSVDNKAPAIVFHNGDKFDVSFILNRLQHNGLSTKFFDGVLKEDTLKLLKKQAGYYELDSLEKNMLYRIFKGYTESMITTGSTKLINPSNGDLAYNFIELAELIELSTKNKKDPFSALLKLHAGEAAVKLRTIGSEIFEELQLVAERNRTMQWMLLDTKWLESLEAQEFFQKYVTNVLGLTPIEVVELYGTYLNPSKLLYALADDVNAIGFKNVIDFTAINEWFNVQLGAEMDPRIVKAYTNIGKTLDRMYNNIKHPERLEPYADKIKQAVDSVIGVDVYDLMDNVNENRKIIQNIAAKAESDYAQGIITKVEFDSITASVQNELQLLTVKLNETSFKLNNRLRTDKTDARSNWTLLQYLYNKFQRGKTLGAIPQAAQESVQKVWETSVDPDLLLLLEHPEFINTNYITDKGSVLTSTGNILPAPLRARIDEMFARPEHYRTAVLEAQTSADNMNNLGKLLDTHELSRSKAQALSAAIMEVHDMLELYETRMNNIDVTTRQVYRQAYKAYANNLAEQQLYNIITQTPEELQKFMVWKAPWFEVDIMEYFNMPHMQDAWLKLMEQTDVLKQYHINIFKENNRFYFYLDKNAILDGFSESGLFKMTLNGEIIPAPIMKDLDIETAAKLLNDPEMAEALRKARMTIHRLAGSLDGSDAESIGSLGDLVSKDFYAELYKQLPEEVKKNMPSLEDLLRGKFFKRERFNFTNLGSLDMRRVKQPYGYGSIISLYQHSSQNAALLANTKIQYAQLWYNSALSINSGWMKTASSEDLLKLFKEHPEYILSALVEDAKIGYKVAPIKPTTVKDLMEARRLNAILMDYQTFNTAFESINYNNYGKESLNLWRKIIYLYKVGYLLDPGVWMRNTVDSMLKNFNESGSFTGTLKAEYDAARLYHLYNRCIDDIIKIDPLGRFKNINAESYFTDATYDGIRALDKATYDFIHAFIIDGPSAGLSGNRWAKYFSFRGENSTDEMFDVWQTIVHYSSKTMLPNQYVEQITRLAEYLMFAESSMTTAQAYQQIAKTHFNYGVKSDFEKGAELVFPFYTFAMRNIEYWINAIEEHPWIASIYRDVMTPMWDFQGTDYNELSRNQSLQYQILSGNVPLNDKGLTLKTSPSFMDTFGVFTQPIDTIKGRMAAPLQFAIDSAAQHNITRLSNWAMKSLNIYEQQKLAEDAGYRGVFEQGSSLIPIIGVLYQRYFEMGPNYYSRTGNLLNKFLPGSFGATLRYQPRGYTARKIYPKPQKDYYQKAKTKRRKPFVYKSFAKRVYSTQYYYKRSYVPHNKNLYKNYYNKRPLKYESFYKNHYSKSGISRMKMRMSPARLKSLQYKLKDMFRYFR